MWCRCGVGVSVLFTIYGVSGYSDGHARSYIGTYVRTYLLQPRAIDH